MCPLMMRRWGRVACDDLVMFRGEWLMHHWERVIWFKLMEQKKDIGRPKVALMEIIKKWNVN